MNKSPIKILVVGQTPPPYGGQAMMINRLVKAKFENVQVFHVRMSFSDSFKSVGSFGIKKILHIFEVAYQTLALKFKENIQVLYFPPAGPNRNPILRDIILLFLIRFFFKKKIYHFRAAGISEFLNKQSTLFRTLAKLAYGKPSGAIQLSSLNPPDGAFFEAEKVFIIPNGLEDAATHFLPITKENTPSVNILFVGVLREDKGVSVLIQAATLLKNLNRHFRITFLGEFVSNEYEAFIMNQIKLAGLSEHINFPGVKTGESKWRFFYDADVFCFPSFFDAESFGNVALEAMMFQLPVIATHWRGIPDIVVNGETGLLVPIKDPAALAEALSLLVNDYGLRTRMGSKGRERFTTCFTLPKHLVAMEEAFIEISGENKLIPEAELAE